MERKSTYEKKKKMTTTTRTNKLQSTERERERERQQQQQQQKIERTTATKTEKERQRKTMASFNLWPNNSHLVFNKTCGSTFTKLSFAAFSKICDNKEIEKVSSLNPIDGNLIHFGAWVAIKWAP